MSRSSMVKSLAPGDLVEVKPMKKYSPHPKDPRELGGTGVVVSVREEKNYVIWYNIFLNGQLVDNIIDTRVEKHPASIEKSPKNR